MPGTQRDQGRPQSRRGDATGHKADVLRREAEDQLEARREEIGMLHQSTENAKQNGVVDLTGEEPVLDYKGDAALDGKLVGNDGSLYEAPQEVSGGTQINSGSSYTVEEIEPPTESLAQISADEVVNRDALNRPVLIRAEYDLEDVTIGYGNTYTLKQGWRYKVPRHVAIHLESKNVITVLDLLNA